MKVKRTEPPSAYEEIMKKADIVDVARRLKMYVSEDDWTVCPFHGDGQEMSLMLNRKTNKFYCPACQKEGDVVDLYREIRKVDSIQAILRLGKAYGVTDPPKEKEEQAKQIKSRIFSCQALQEQEFPPLKFFVEGILPKGVLILNAQPKTGKSFLMMQLALAVASGQPFLGFQTNRSGVLYYALDDGVRRFQGRMNAMLKGESAPPLFYGGTEAKMLDDGFLEELKAEITANPGIELVIIDTLACLRERDGKNEYSYTLDHKDIKAFVKFSKDNDVGIVLVHHSKKAKDESDPLNNINGTNGLSGAADTLWALIKNKRIDDEVTFFVSGRDIAQEEYLLRFDRDNSCEWSLVGRKAEYLSHFNPDKEKENLCVETVKALVEESGSWSGTAQEFLDKVKEYSGQDIGCTAKSAGMKIKNIEGRLYKEGISHSIKRTATNNVHTFLSNCTCIPNVYL